MIWFFLFFFISGFCSILYELVWLRLSMAQFGVNTALTSIVLSVFMAGMGLGSWLAGKFVRRGASRIKISPLQLYGLAEFLIGCSALSVPMQLAYGHHLLAGMAGRVAMSSGSFYWVSGSWLSLSLIPWCACMGATIPLGMFAIRNEPRFAIRRSFSFLYVANVLGAIIGTFVPLLLIEGYGFHGALEFGAALNLFIAVGAFSVDRVMRRSAQPATVAQAKTEGIEGPSPLERGDRNGSALALLFATGVVTMGMEIIWIRLFTRYAGPLVYAFAAILMSYLVGTLVGSRIYRIKSRKYFVENRLWWVLLAPLGLLPLLTGDIRLPISFVLRVMPGIAPFAAVIGFLTPMLVDRWSGGDPDRAGRAYAVNILGCIAGPLLAGFVLLPIFGERVSMVIFVLPWVLMAIPNKRLAYGRPARALAACGLLVAGVFIFAFSRDYETEFPNRQVIRDSTATVIATGFGLHKLLIVNGTGMTAMTPITKMMAHMTMSSTPNPPKNVLIICFGMGTTFRSTINWGVPTTVIELVPSVPKLFTYYHPDGEEYLNSPYAHVVIDDGRRYLERTHDSFDVILIDPPPPVEAAGSSLLYSQDFYDLVKRHLNPGGIFQQWLPGGDDAVHAAVARALKNEFPYIRVYPSVELWGLHFLASMTPIPERTAEEHIALMPKKAIADMMEWGPARTPEGEFNLMLANEMTVDQVIAYSPQTAPLRDDRPINEYFMMRRSPYNLVNMEKELQQRNANAAPQATNAVKE
jgi:predicted membrane-bound spermidine synthase